MEHSEAAGATGGRARLVLVLVAGAGLAMVVVLFSWARADAARAATPDPVQAPATSAAGPGNSANAPGHTTTPGSSADSPGHTTSPDNSATAPGRTASPGNSASAPGHCHPGQLGHKQGQAVNRPRQRRPGGGQQRHGSRAHDRYQPWQRGHGPRAHHDPGRDHRPHHESGGRPEHPRGRPSTPAMTSIGSAPPTVGPGMATRNQLLTGVMQLFRPASPAAGLPNLGASPTPAPDAPAPVPPSPRSLVPDGSAPAGTTAGSPAPVAVLAGSAAPLRRRGVPPPRPRGAHAHRRSPPDRRPTRLVL